MSTPAIPYDMFDLERNAEDAKRADRLRGIYHRGQEQAWDGRTLLPELLAKHGGVHVKPDVKEALARRGRLLVLETVADAKAGHVGGPLSAMDLLVALFFRVLRIDPQRPDWFPIIPNDRWAAAASAR